MAGGPDASLGSGHDVDVPGNRREALAIGCVEPFCRSLHYLSRAVERGRRFEQVPLRDERPSGRPVTVFRPFGTIGDAFFVGQQPAHVSMGCRQISSAAFHTAKSASVLLAQTCDCERAPTSSAASACAIASVSLPAVASANARFSSAEASIKPNSSRCASSRASRAADLALDVSDASP